jgi:uncharacterized delta-60 repeat protein
MNRSVALLIPFALLVACGGESGTDAVVTSYEPGVHPLAPPTPGPTPFPTCNILTPAIPPPAAGDMDAGFGCGGIASYADATLDIPVRAIAVQADDKIIAVGETYNTQSNHHNVWAARFTSNGKLDTTFATAGIYTKNFTGGVGGATSAHAVVVQPSGAIVIGGGWYSEDPGAGRKAFLVRLLADGTPDASFGTAGLVETTAMTTVLALNLQTNGNLVAAGEKCVHPMNQPETCNAAVGRFSGVDGAVDVAFGTAGFTTTNYGGSAPSIAYAAAANGNDVVVAGRAKTGSEDDVGLARYGATGLDATFGVGGTLKYDAADTEAARAIVKSGTGYVFAESFNVSGSEYFLLTRIQSNGAANPNFGFNGRFFVMFAGYGAQASALAMTANSQIIAVGSARTSTNHNRMAVARVNGLGGLDNSFSDDGSLMISAGGEESVGNAVALQSTGRIVIGGWAQSSGGKKRAVLARVRDN